MAQESKNRGFCPPSLLKMARSGATLGALLLSSLMAPLALGKEKRAPANYIPNDEVMSSPYHELSYEKIFRPDRAGVLEKAQEDFHQWQEEEEFEQSWGVQPLNRHDIRSEKQRRRHISKMSLRYLDERVSGEIKRAPKGSTWEKVGEVRKTLSPRPTFRLGKHYRLKFRGKVIRGKAKMMLSNPHGIHNELELKYNGRLKAKVGKDFSLSSVAFKSEFSYDLTNERYEALIQSPLYRGLLARARQIHDPNGPLSPEGHQRDSRIEIVYSTFF